MQRCPGLQNWLQKWRGMAKRRGCGVTVWECSHLFTAEANHRHHCRGFLVCGSLHALPSQLNQTQTILKAACIPCVPQQGDPAKALNLHNFGLLRLCQFSMKPTIGNVLGGTACISILCVSWRQSRRLCVMLCTNSAVPHGPSKGESRVLAQAETPSHICCI